LSKLVSHFLTAPADQVDARILADAKTWSLPMPTPEQFARTLKLADKYPMTKAARRVLLTIGQEAEEARQVVFDNNSVRPLQ
jgi:hypothetical protein